MSKAYSAQIQSNRAIVYTTAHLTASDRSIHRRFWSSRAAIRRFLPPPCASCSAPYFRTPAPSLFSCLHFSNLPFWKWTSVALPASREQGFFMPGFRLVAAELTSLSEPESEAAVGLEPARERREEMGFCRLVFEVNSPCGCSLANKQRSGRNATCQPNPPGASSAESAGVPHLLSKEDEFPLTNGLPGRSAVTDIRSSSAPRSASRARCMRPRCRGGAGCPSRP